MVFGKTKRVRLQRPLKVGDRVRIKKYRTWVGWGDRKPQKYGFITNINGAYILVRPRWQRHEIEFYPAELASAPLRRR